MSSAKEDLESVITRLIEIGVNGRGQSYVTAASLINTLRLISKKLDA